MNFSRKSQQTKPRQWWIAVYGGQQVVLWRDCIVVADNWSNNPGHSGIALSGWPSLYYWIPPLFRAILLHTLFNLPSNSCPKVKTANCLYPDLADLGSKLHMKQKGVLQVYLTNFFINIRCIELILNKFMHWRALSSMQVGWPPVVDLCLSQIEAIGKGWKEEKMQERLWIAANWDFGLQAAEQSQSTAGGLPCKDCILTNACTTIIILKIWHKLKDFLGGIWAWAFCLQGLGW